MNKYFNSFLIILTLILTAAAASLTLFFITDSSLKYYSNYNNIRKKIKSDTFNDINTLEKNIKSIENNVLNTAALLVNLTGKQESVINVLKKSFENNPPYFQIAAAYKQYMFDKNKKLYAPFAYKNNNSIKIDFIENHYDYTDDKHSWFHDTFKKKKGWTKTYYGKAGESMMASYCSVIEKNKQDIGIVIADFSFEDIYKVLAARDRGSYGYGFILDEQGTVIAHPNKELTITRNNILDFASSYSEKTQNELKNSIKKHSEIIYKAENSFTGQRSLIFIAPVPSTKWFLGNVIVLDETEIPETVRKKHYLKILTSFLFFMLFLGLYKILNSKKEELPNKLYIGSIRISIYFGIGILLIWVLQVTSGSENVYTENFFGSREQTARFMREQINKAEKERRKKPIFIDTGVLIRSAKLTDLNEAEIYGIVWQRIPKGMSDSLAGVRFPDAVSSEFEKNYEIEEREHLVTGWYFKALIRQHYDNRIYPFDRINLRLRMRQRKEFSSLIFVPDLQAYELTSPSSKSFAANNISIPGWEVDKTYFTHYGHAYDIDYGIREFRRDDYVRDLVLNVQLSRDWLGHAVSVLIPIIIIIAFSYTALLMICNREEERKLFNFDAMRMLVIGASFSLFLVIATQNLRSRVVSESVIYIEQLYFLIYFILLVNVISAIEVTRSRRRVFSFGNGVIFKTLYWPVVTFVIYMITLLNFY